MIGVGNTEQHKGPQRQGAGVMQRISASQSKKARGLLKWNIRDLSHRTNISVERITSFEKGLVHLYQRENQDVIDTLRKEGIIFEEFGEVILEASASQRVAGHKPSQSTSSMYKPAPVHHVTDSEIERLYGTAKSGDDDEDRQYRYSTD